RTKRWQIVVHGDSFRPGERTAPQARRNTRPDAERPGASLGLWVRRPPAAGVIPRDEFVPGGRAEQRGERARESDVDHARVWVRAMGRLDGCLLGDNEGVMTK